jgi:hypothetical protein
VRAISCGYECDASPQGDAQMCSVWRAVSWLLSSVEKVKGRRGNRMVSVSVCDSHPIQNIHPRMACGTKIDSVCVSQGTCTHLSHGGTFPHACSFNHSPPCSSYSALVTREALPSSVPLHSAMPLHASRRGSPPSSEDTILRGARKGRTGVRVFRSLGIKLGTLAPPPVTKMHWAHQTRFRTLHSQG